MNVGSVSFYPTADAIRLISELFGIPSQPFATLSCGHTNLLTRYSIFRVSLSKFFHHQVDSRLRRREAVNGCNRRKIQKGKRLQYLRLHRQPTSLDFGIDGRNERRPFRDRFLEVDQNTHARRDRVGDSEQCRSFPVTAITVGCISQVEGCKESACCAQCSNGLPIKKVSKSRPPVPPRCQPIWNHLDLPQVALTVAIGAAA